jgi:hypothetical protein
VRVQRRVRQAVRPIPRSVTYMRTRTAADGDVPRFRSLRFRAARTGVANVMTSRQDMVPRHSRQGHGESDQPSRFTVSMEKAGTQTAMYSAPPASGLL